MTRVSVHPSSGAFRLALWGLAALAALALACGGGEEEAAPAEYAQADLAGTWDQVAIHVGLSPAWLRRTVSIDAQGTLTVLAAESDGSTTPPPGPLVLRIDGGGNLSQTTAGVADRFHGALATSKRLFAAVATPTSGTQALLVSRRRDGAVMYTDDDIRGRAFEYHSLRAGTEGWRHGSGSFDTDGVASIAVYSYAGGTPGAPPLHGKTFSVVADGLVTDGAQLQGFLTADKSAIFFVHTDGTAYTLTAVQFRRASGAFLQSDLAGTFAFQSLACGSGAIWHHGTVGIDAGGVVTWTSYLDSAGGTAPPPGFTVALAGDGTLTSATNPTYHGMLAIDRDLYVRTQTHGNGFFGMAVALRR